MLKIKRQLLFTTEIISEVQSKPSRKRPPKMQRLSGSFPGGDRLERSSGARSALAEHHGQVNLPIPENLVIT